MSRTLSLAAFAAVVAFLFVACTQAEGERCQQDEDCEPLLCVGADGLGESGHCCPQCDTGESGRWVFVEDEDGEGGINRCGCVGATTDGDADADQDAAAVGDGSADGAADGAGDAAPDAAETDGGDGGPA